MQKQQQEDINIHSDNQQQYQEEQSTLKQFFKIIGPGLLISMGYLDPGNISGDMQAGLKGHYNLLIILFISTTLGYFFQIRAMKLGLVSGKDLAELCRIHLSKQTSILLWIMAEVAIIGSDIQEVLGTAISFNILFGIKLWIGVILAIIISFVFLLIKQTGDKKFEIIICIFLIIMGISFFMNLFFIQPSFQEIVSSFFIPNIPKSAIFPMMGLIGAVLMPHNLYLHSSLMKEKEIDRNDIFYLQKIIPYFKFETGFSLLFSFLINSSIIITFAYYFNSQTQDITLQNAGNVLEQSFGIFSKYIWGIGLFCAGQSSTLTGTLAGQYIMTGFIKMNISQFGRTILSRLIAIGPSLMIAFWSEESDFNDYLNALQAIQLPFAIIPLLKFVSSEDIMGQQFAIGKFELYSLTLFSFCIVGMNYVNVIINFQNAIQIWEENMLLLILIIIVLILIALIYFLFMFYLIWEKIQWKQEFEYIQIQQNKNQI